MNVPAHFLDLPPESRKALTMLQWLVVIGTSYLVLFEKGDVVIDPRATSLVVVLFISVAALHCLPGAAFAYRFFPHALVILDTLLITMGIGLNREGPWDLFIVFFFGLFIAGTGENLIQVVIGCLIISLLSVSVNLFQGTNPHILDPDLLFRVPFIFGVSIVYGYLADRVRSEKRRAERAEETEKLKRQLVSALAHDIKNPLGVIQGYAETVGARLDSGSARQENQEALGRIQDNVQRIVKLVTGFLDASKVEAGKIELVEESVQLNALIREVGQQQVGELRKRNLILSVDLDPDLPEVRVDAGQIDRVLWNLLGNAIKFTPMGGRITVQSKLDNGYVRVSVKDTGMGIPKDELPVLFSEFRRLKGAGKIEGTGLGLFVVKTIVEAHGGKVDVDSIEGEGTTFSVYLPIRG